MNARKNIILSINGGGVWGFGVARYLEQCASLSAFSASTLPIAFAGTSVGSIVATCLACGMNETEIVYLFRAHTKKIFTKEGFFSGLNKANTYSSKYAEGLFKEVFGNDDFTRKQLKPLFIPVTNVTEDKTEVFSIDQTPNIPLWFAVLASMSTPTYFAPAEGKKVGIKGTFVDGGLWANNPSLAGLCGMMHLEGKKEEDYSLLSIGTSGTIARNNKVNFFLKAQWLPVLLQFLTVGNEESTNFYLKRIMNNKNFLAIVPDLFKGEDYALDATNNLEQIKNIWEREFLKTREQLNFFTKEG